MKYVALGDFVIFIIYGLLISFGVVYVMTDQLYWPILLITTPIGLLIVAILHANNTRDILNDGKADIKTMAMLLGLKTSKIYFVLLNAGAYIGVICLVLFKLSHPLTFLVFLTLPPVIKNISQIVAVKSEAELDKIKTLTEQEAKLVALFAILQATSYFIIGSI